MDNFRENLKSNSALLYNKGYNFWKSVSTWKIPQNWKFWAEANIVLINRFKIGPN